MDEYARWLLRKQNLLVRLNGLSNVVYELKVTSQDYKRDFRTLLAVVAVCSETCSITSASLAAGVKSIQRSCERRCRN